MEKICTLIKFPNEKRVNIKAYYLTKEAYNWWSTVKDRLVGLEFTWSKFLNELRAKFDLITIQQQKEKKFTELRMTGNTTVMQYASKFSELSRFVPEFLASERMKMRRFDEGLAFYIHNQLEMASLSIPIMSFMSVQLNLNE